jgi:3-oxoacyl-[acyl-carrier-protein] synthase-3
MPFLHSFGHYLPERIVANDELAQACAVDPAWIVDVSGIHERRYAAPAETTATLALHAARHCLANAGLSAADLGMIVVSSGSAERFCPGPAAIVAAGLGLNSTPALDIPVASAGSLTGLALATQFAPAIGRVLVIGSEIMSRRIDRTPEGRNTAILFGDGAGAALIDPSHGFARIAGHTLYTDGAFADALFIANDRLHMEGMTIIAQASRKIPRAVTTLLEQHSLSPADIGHVLMHQANLNLIEKVARATAIDRSRFFVNIARYGNTSSASLLIAASEWHAANPTLTSPLVFTAFGAGLNWGALLAVPA